MDQAQLRRLFEALQVLTGDRGAAGKRALRVEEFEKLFGTADARTQKRLQEISASAEQQAGAISTILDDLIQLNQETSNIVQYVDQEVSGARNDAQQALTAATTALDTELAAARGEAAAALAEARAEIDTDITQARSDAAQALATAQSEAAQALADARAALEERDGEIETSVAAIAVTVGQNTAAISSEATTRATADQALSAQITTVSAGVASNTAAISEEAIARATADTSLAAQITTLTATVDTNTAEISAEQIARAAADTALAADITALTATVGTNTANIAAEQIARANADSALAADINTVSAANAANAAAITSEAAARANADTALAADITTLTASVGTNAAAIAAEATTRATADSALATQINTLNTSVGANAAAISAESTARTTADSALAAQITALTSTVGENTASINEEALTRATADNTLAAQISTIQAEFFAPQVLFLDGPEGSLLSIADHLQEQSTIQKIVATVQAESVARASEDQALAAQITALTSTVGENTASINEEALTRATADNTLAAQISTIQAEFFAPQVLFLDGPEGSLLSIADHLQEQSTIQKIVATVQAESVARASEDQALAAQITTVNAEFSSESMSLVRDRFLALQNSANWSRDQGQGTLNIVPNDLFSFGQTWRFTTALGQQDGLFTRSDRATWRGVRNSNAFRVEIDFTLQSGSLAGAGVAVDWQNTASTVFRRAIALSDMLVGPVVAGQPARATAIFRRPTDFSGTFDFTTLRAWANNAAIGNGAKEIRFHRISIWPANADEALVAETAAAVVQEAIARADGDGALAAQINTVSSNVGSLAATVTQQASALTTLEGYAAATLAFRAQAGSAGATLELVASNNPSGPASAARIDAQNIILNGSVTATQLATVNLITQTAQIANGIVTNAKIADATIQGAKIADATITSAKIENAAITSAKIGDAQITSAKIADTIQSTNFVSGPTGSGWRIQMNGDAEFGTLSLRQNAVTQTRHQLVTNPSIFTGGTHPRAWVNVAEVNYIPFSANTTTLFLAEFQLEMVITTSNGFRNAVYDWELLWRNTVIASGQENVFAERTSVNVTTEKTIDVQKFKISPGSTSGQLLLRMRFVEQSGTAPFFSFGVKYAEVASLEFKR